MIIDTNPEFGVELACVIPYAYWLHTQGQLEKVVTSKGMKPFYFFCDNVEEKYTSRSVDNGNNGVQHMPNTWNHHNAKAITGRDYQELTESEKFEVNGVLDYSKWKCPPYSKIYKEDIFKFDKPHVIVSNKIVTDHGRTPVGYFDIEALYNIFNELTTAGYKVIYKRPKMTEYPVDMNEINSRNLTISANVEGRGIMTDYDLVEEYDDVILFDDLITNDSYNITQLKWFSTADFFVSISGGNSIFCCLFEKPVLTYVSVSNECRPGYFDGDCYYKKLSSAEVISVIDVEKDILHRGHRDYSEFYVKLKKLIKNEKTNNITSH